jgi:hypothetical protein
MSKLILPPYYLNVAVRIRILTQKYTSTKFVIPTTTREYYDNEFRRKKNLYVWMVIYLAVGASLCNSITSPVPCLQ